jgi:hypothetical protein
VIALVLWVTFATPPVARPERAIAGVTAYADVELRFADGEVSVGKITPGKFAKPTALPRYRGRFTAIVAQGKKNLVELDFDFPLLAVEAPDATDDARKLGQQIRKGVTSSTSVRVPLPEGADSLAIYDSVTHKTVKATLAASPSGAPRAR